MPLVGPGSSAQLRPEVAEEMRAARERALANGASAEEADAAAQAALQDHAGESDNFFTRAARGMFGSSGPDAGASSRTREQAAQSAAQRAWEALGESIPTEESQQWHSQGEDTLGRAEAEKAAADPYSIEAQRRAMAQLGDVYGGYQDIYSHGGLTDADRARIQQSQMEQKRFERGQSEAAMQQAAARGMLGGGGELLARTQAQQEGANRANAQGLGIEALAEQRAMAALGGMGETSGAQGSLASGMRGQSFEEEYRRRRAADERAQFNSGIAGRNVDRTNEDQRHNAGLGQTAFENRTTVTRGRTGQYDRQADSSAQEAERRRADQAAREARAAGTVSGIISGVASGGSSIAAAQARRAAEEDDE